MSYTVRRSLPPPRPYGSRPYVGRPYSAAPVVAGGASSLGSSGALGGALGALGGTLGCLLCLAAIGALGLFSCVVALTAYTKQFLDEYKDQVGLTDGSAHMQIGLLLLFVSLFYSMASRMQRS